ncbi:MAG: glutamate 5-kinase [Oscillospiraceae bacterium]|nr:glutamate 5-kinase [Oscillospiraceae bacterium]
MDKINKTDGYIYVSEIKKSKRIVIKIGSATLTHATGKLNLKRIESLVKTISDFSNMGKEIILVSSGAVSAGMAKLGIKTPAIELLKIEDKKAAAAVGQAELMTIYDRFFSSFGIKIAQMLLTRDVIDNDIRRKNAEETLSVLIKLGCVIIVNENDPVSSDELKFSGNDILAAYVSKLCKADLLINLSDRDGLYDKNPSKYKEAKLIHIVEELTPEILSYAGGAGLRGTGGFVTKLQAAQMIAEEKTPMIIANGKNPEILYDILDGKIAGTYIGNGEK